MIKQITHTVLVAVTLLFAASCREKDPEPTGNGSIKLEFSNKVGGSALNLAVQTYTNDHGDTFTVSKFNYYISNVKMANTNSSVYTENESYHLLQHDNNSTMSFDLATVPYGNYNQLTFMLGVDSTHNVSGAQGGALDPLNGMFWTWNTGYIMLKFEGNSPQSTGPGGLVQIHCGGFTGANSVVRTITLTLPNTITVGKNATPHVHIDADVLKMLKSPNQINFATTNLVMTPGVEAKQIADNYAGMFSISYAGL